MKRRLIAFALLGSLMLLMVPSRSRAEDYAYNDEYEFTQSHPLRVAAYLLYPIGVAMEWAFFRPFHYLVSLPGAAEVFGHHQHGPKVVY